MWIIRGNCVKMHGFDQDFFHSASFLNPFCDFLLSLFSRGSHGRRKTILFLLFLLLLLCPVWFYGALVTWPCINSTFLGARSLFPPFSSPPTNQKNSFLFQSEGWLWADERVRLWAEKNESRSQTKIYSAKFLPTLLSPTQAPTKTPPERGNEEEAVGFFSRPEARRRRSVRGAKKPRFFLPSEVNENKGGRLGGRGPLLSSLELEKCLFLAPSPPSLSPLPSS